jgi:hypothetical protein
MEEEADVLAEFELCVGVAASSVAATSLSMNSTLASITAVAANTICNRDSFEEALASTTCCRAAAWVLSMVTCSSKNA